MADRQGPAASVRVEKIHSPTQLCKKCELNMSLPRRNVHTRAPYNKPIYMLMPGGALCGAALLTEQLLRTEKGNGHAGSAGEEKGDEEFRRLRHLLLPCEL